MAQSITLKIAGREYPLAAPSEDAEQAMRLAADDINQMLAKYDAKFPDKQLLDKLIFVTLNEAVAKINAQRKFNALAGEVRALQAETDAYLTTLKEK
ncbi:MAG: cell division protein ZapA [Bacteroidales bacterium]|nr:cell division protein ZapA [Bacteroidales bacterium]